MKRILWVCLLAFGIILYWSVVVAGDFYVIPVKGQVTSWDKKIDGATRFKLVLDGEAVLDKETGLVWEKAPDTTEMLWPSAAWNCYLKEIGDRRGWRLPAIEELASLIGDPGQVGVAELPAGHPFIGVWSSYWSTTTCVMDTSQAFIATFSTHPGSVSARLKNTSNNRIWCVRGGYGHDAY